jgi:hypothetical protein
LEWYCVEIRNSYPYNATFCVAGDGKFEELNPPSLAGKITRKDLKVKPRMSSLILKTGS